MKRLSIAPDASQDLRDIIDYFSNVNVEAGERFIEAFNSKLCQISQFSKIGRIYTNFVNPLRGVTLNNYIILYRTLDNSIEILRVVSGYRDLDSLFEDTD